MDGSSLPAKDNHSESFLERRLRGRGLEQRAAAGSMARNEVGVGCALGTSEQNDAVIVKGLVHGGPCHLSCAVGVGDVVVSVDGTPVGGDVRLAKQLFLGEDNSGVTLALRRGGNIKSVHLLRGKTVEVRAMKEGEVCGIGVTLSSVRDGLVISKIAQGSPAQLSGELQTLDVIVNIGGVDVQGKAPADAAQLIVGPVGTRVALTIVRGRGSRRQVDIIRAQNLEGSAVQKAAQYRYNALVEQQALAYPWIRRMVRKVAKSVHGGQGTVNEVSFEGAPCPIRIALKVVYQRGSSFKSAERSLWLNVDNHPHILPLLFTAGPNMLFMPFMELASVTDWLAASTEARALPADDLRLVHQMIGLQVAWALEHMHKVGTLHLDMKPNNILVRLRGDARTPLYKRLHCLVCDFGLAAVNIEGSATGRGGTPGGFAPHWRPEGAGERARKPAGGREAPCTRTHTHACGGAHTHSRTHAQATGRPSSSPWTAQARPCPIGPTHAQTRPRRAERASRTRQTRGCGRRRCSQSSTGSTACGPRGSRRLVRS